MLFFFKAFCLSRGGIPDVSHSTMVTCLNQESNKGAKCKTVSWVQRCRFTSSVQIGHGGEKLLTNATTHFWSKCVKDLPSVRTEQGGRLPSSEHCIYRQMGRCVSEWLKEVIPIDAKREKSATERSIRVELSVGQEECRQGDEEIQVSL